MASTQGYRQVVVVPTVVSQPVSRSDFLRKGVKVGGLAVGLPCAICLSVAGVIAIISAVSLLSVEEFDFDDDDIDFHFDNDPLYSVGIVILLIGIGFIVASIALCYLGHRQYKKLSEDSAGRVINLAPTVAVPASSYPMAPNTYSPNVAQVPPYPSPGTQQAATYQPPGGGQMAPQMKYPGAPPAGQMPYGSPSPAGQMPYAAASPAGQMPYPVVSSYGQKPYSVAQGPAVAQVPPYPGQQQYGANPPYQAQAPEMAPGLPSKSGVPGEVDLATAYERPPPYAP